MKQTEALWQSEAPSGLHSLRVETRIVSAPLATGGEFAFDWIETVADWDPSRLRDYPVVLLPKSNVRSMKDESPWLVGPTERALRDFVEAGGGLVAVHFGTAGYKNSTERSWCATSIIRCWSTIW